MFIYKKIGVFNLLRETAEEISLKPFDITSIGMTSFVWEEHNQFTFLTHIPLVLHICVAELGHLNLDNGLLPVQHQAIT